MRQTYLSVLSLIFISSCHGQIKGKLQKDSLISKVKKNHFIPEFSEETFYVQCGLQEKAGKMWFGTAGNGIYVYDGNSFANFTHKSFVNFSLKEDLNHNDILCCMEDKTGNIWFGTRRGLIQYKPSKNKVDGKDFMLYLIPANTISDSGGTRLPYTLKTGDNFVWSIMQDKSGKILFGTSRGVYVHNPSTDNDKNGPLFRRLLDNNNIINDQKQQLINVMSMLEDISGNIWFVVGGADAKGIGMPRDGAGIVRYDGKSLVNFTPDSLDSFRSVIQRQNGDLLFLNSFHGVYSYDGNSFSNLSKKIGIQNDTLVSMLEDKNGNLWFGINTTNMIDGGVLSYDGKSLKRFTTKDGLSHNCVFCIVDDNDGNIWFGTRYTGLCRYDGKTFTDYTER